MKSYQIVTCPSDSTTPEVTLPTIGRVRRSYSYANYIREGTGSATPATNAPGRSLAAFPAAFPAASLTVLLSERTGQTNDGATKMDTANYNRFAATAHTREWAAEGGKNFANDQAGAQAVPSGTAGRHLGTNNILYADGHVKAIKMTAGSSLGLTGHQFGGTGQGTWVNSEDDLPKG